MSFDRMVIFGRAVKGLEKSNLFMEVPWVKEQFVLKLGFIPHPGTFNLEIRDKESLMRWKDAKSREGIGILPREDGFCSGRCYRVVVADRIEGAAVVPEISGYPDSKLEIIAPHNIRAELGLTDGDLVKVEVVVAKAG